MRDLLRRIPIPERLAARVWLITLPSGVLSFERRQEIPRLPLGRLRLAGLVLLTAGLFLILRGRGPGVLAGERATGLSRIVQQPAVGGGFVVLSGVATLLRSGVLAAYTIALAFAYTRDVVDLEEPRLPANLGGRPDFNYDETTV